MDAALRDRLDAQLKRAREARAAGDRNAALAAFCAAAEIDPGHPGLDLEMGRLLRELGRLEEAETRFRQAVALEPDNVAAHVGLGHVQRERNRRIDSLTTLQAVAGRHPQHIGIKLAIAEDLRELGQLAKAENIIGEILCQEPENVSALTALAHIKRRQGHRTASLSYFQQASRLDPSHSWAKVEIGDDLRELGRFDEAEVVFRSVLQERCDHLGALMGLGHVTRRRADRSASLTYFKRATQLDPDHIWARIEMAEDLRELGLCDQAETTLRALLEQNPHHVGVLVGLGHVKRRQGDRSVSLTYFEEAARLDPRHVWAQIEMAQDLRELGRYNEAEATLRAVLEQNPTQVGALLGLGHVKRCQGDRSTSLSYFEQAARLDPRNTWAQIEMANDLRQLGRHDQAEIILCTVIEQSPNHIGALVELGRTKRDQGQRLKSIQYFERAAQIDPRHVWAKLELVDDLRELGRYGEAEQLIKSAIEIDRFHSHAHARYGILLRHTGRNAEALTAFEMAAKCDSNNPSFQIELANCYQELGNNTKAETILFGIINNSLENHRALLALCSVLIDSYRVNEARSIIDNALNVKASPEVYLARGRLSRRLNNRSEALDFFQRARELSPDSQEVLLEIIEELRVRGSFTEANCLASELAEKKQTLPALLQIGKILRDQGQHHLALEIFVKAVDKFPNAPQAQLELATEYRLIGQPGKSEELLTSILNVNQHYTEAFDKMIEHFELADDPENALILCRRAIEMRPCRHWPYLKAAHAATRLCQIELAESFLDNACRASGNHPEIVATRIELLRSIRKFNEAEEYYKSLPEELANNFFVLVQAIYSALSIDALAVAQQRLSNLMPQNAIMASTVAQLKARTSEITWKHAEAISHYQDALDLFPDNIGLYWEISKCALILFKPSVARDYLKKFLRLNVSASILRGESHNASQNYLGQFIDEFLLDEELLLRLQSLDEVYFDERVRRLYKIVADNPDHTPSAIALLISLRKSGALDLRPVISPLSIPRSIVQFWDAPPLPEAISNLTATWRVSNPDYAYRLFDKQAASAFLREHHSAATLAAFHRACEPAQQADIFRLAYLASFGGFYADCDDRGSSPIEGFVPGNTTFVCYQEEYGTLGNNFVGATANHPVIWCALERAVESVNRGDQDMIWFSTGPGLMTRAFAQVIAAAPAEFLPKSAIYTVGQLQRHLGLHCPVSYKITKHWLKTFFATKRKAG